MTASSTKVRSETIDAVRSFALLGICVVNVPFLALPIDAWLSPPEGRGDWLAAFAVELLFQGKFFVLFSFLFGWGVGAQLAAWARDGRLLGATYVRRMLALFLIGLAHATLVFYGDILMLYAVLGLMLWPLRGLSPRALMGVAGLALLAATLSLVVMAALPESGGRSLQAAIARSGYLGSFAEAVRQRLADWRLAAPFIMGFQGPIAFAAFAAGLAAHKAGFFRPDSAARRGLARTLPYLAVPAIAGNALYAMSVSNLLGQDVLAALAFAAVALAGPALAALYLAAVMAPADAGRLPSWLIAPGRMSLSAYIAQGSLASLLFNGYGLALFGRLGPLALLGAALAIHAAVCLLCLAWLAVFRDGPLEVLLRRLTHGR